MALRSLKMIQHNPTMKFVEKDGDSLPSGIAMGLHEEIIDEVLEFYGINKVTPRQIQWQKWIAWELEYDLNWDTYVKHNMKPEHIAIVEQWFATKGKQFPGWGFLAYKQLINGQQHKSSVNTEWQTQLQEQSTVSNAEVQPWTGVQWMDESQGKHQEWSLND